MARTETSLFGLGLQGKSPNVTANKLVNAYYEFQKQEDRTKVAIYGTPGLTAFVDQGDTPWRGLHVVPGVSKIYGVHRGTFYDINNAGTVTPRGTLNTTSGRVDIQDDGTRVIVTDGTNGYGYDTSSPATPIAVISDADYPDTCTTACFQGGRFLVSGDSTGKFYGSDTYSVTAWGALNFATAESNPDHIIRNFNYRGNVVLAGSYTTEYWANVGGSGFPYARILGSDMEYGLAARWSLAKFMGSYAFLAQNREGEVIVAMLQGYNAKRISNFELDHIINDYGSVADATGFGYMLGGHPMYQLNFPNEGKSWLYDGSTNYWSELKSGAGRHRAEIGVDFINQTIVADYSNGKLYRVDPNVYTDNGSAIIMQITGRHIFESNKNIRFDRLELNGEMGVGTATGQGVNPQIMLQLSKDGGHSFGTEIWASIGAVGNYAHRCVFDRLGMGRDIVPRITVSDPVKRVLTTAVLFAEDGR